MCAYSAVHQTWPRQSEQPCKEDYNIFKSVRNHIYSAQVDLSGFGVTKPKYVIFIKLEEVFICYIKEKEWIKK